MSLLDELGIDPEDFHLEDLAACRGMDTAWFFDKEEEYPEDKLTYSDPVIARMIDATCFSCPISQDCYMLGKDGKRWGIWGGVYLQDGEINAKMNSHKTEEDWDEWRNLVEREC
jgi:hypothetical protein